MFPGRLTDPQLGLQLRLVLPYFQASKLAYYCFMDAGKRSKALGSATEVLIPHGTASSISISMLTSVAFGTPSPTGWNGGPDGGLLTQRIALQEGDTELEEPAVLLQAVSKPAPCPGKSPSRLLRAKTSLKNDSGKEQSGPCILSILCKTCRSGRDPTEDCSSSLNVQNWIHQLP